MHNTSTWNEVFCFSQVRVHTAIIIVNIIEKKMNIFNDILFPNICAQTQS